MREDDARLELGEEELAEALEIFRSLIRADTSNPPGRERVAVDLLAAVFDSRGIAYEIHEREPGRASIVARLVAGGRSPDGSSPDGGEGPLILLSHLDVVGADPGLWTHPPFAAEEAELSIWGRGTLDTKQLTAMELAAFLHLAGSTLPPKREIIFAATADEEAGSRHGMEYLSRGPLAGAPGGLAISEGGGFPIRLDGKDFVLCTVGEKGMCRIRLTSGNGTGEAGGPSDGDDARAIADGLRRLLSYEGAPNLGGVARRFLEGAGIAPEKAAVVRAEGDSLIDEGLRGLLRYVLYDSVIVGSLSGPAQETSGGPAFTAEVEFRVDPSMTEGRVREIVASLLRGSAALWEIAAFEPGFESDSASPLPAMLEASCRRYGLDAELLPILALGRTDGRFIGTKGASVFGFSPVLPRDEFREVLKRVHGNDERIGLDSFFFGCRVLTRTIMELCAPLEM